MLKRIAMFSLSIAVASFGVLSIHSANAAAPSDAIISTNVYVVPGTGSYQTKEYNKFLDPLNPEGKKQEKTNQTNPVSYALGFLPTQAMQPIEPTPTLYGPAIAPINNEPWSLSGFPIRPAASSSGSADIAGGSHMNMSSGAVTSQVSVGRTEDNRPKIGLSINGGGLYGTISTGMVADIVEGDNSTVLHYDRHTTASGIVTLGQTMHYQSSIGQK